MMSLVYTNHNANISGYQMIGWSCAIAIGNYVIDSLIMKLAVVSWALWIIKYYAFNILVHCMAFLKQLEK